MKRAWVTIGVCCLAMGVSLAGAAEENAKSKERFAAVVAAMERSGGQEREAAITEIATYQTKEAMKVLLSEFRRLCAERDDMEKAGGDLKKWGWTSRLQEWTAARLESEVPTALPELGPRPDRRSDEWDEWWSRAEPLLTDDLKRKVEKPAARVWRDEEFAKTTEGISLRATVDAQTFRIGDPIRLELVLANGGKEPCEVVLPKLPSGWMPTMAYGIRLKRNDKVVAELAPSEFYVGSYSGPPGFETLGPGEEFRDSICLQYWTENLFGQPLEEGEYELTVMFDSAKFAFMRPKGVERTGKWVAETVKFAVRGGAREDPQEILALVGTKAGLPFFMADLKSPQAQRSEPAWRALYELGDTRLDGVVAEIERGLKGKDRGSHWARSLRPYKVEKRRGRE